MGTLALFSEEVSGAVKINVAARREAIISTKHFEIGITIYAPAQSLYLTIILIQKNSKGWRMKRRRRQKFDFEKILPRQFGLIIRTIDDMLISWLGHVTSNDVAGLCFINLRRPGFRRRKFKQNSKISVVAISRLSQNDLV